MSVTADLPRHEIAEERAHPLRIGRGARPVWTVTCDCGRSFVGWTLLAARADFREHLDWVRLIRPIAPDGVSLP